tara:strand:+ start:3475 stop:3747 length:273 start_codon:yes stop_codon:yes gene_type:complete
MVLVELGGISEPDVREDDCPPDWPREPVYGTIAPQDDDGLADIRREVARAGRELDDEGLADMRPEVACAGRELDDEWDAPDAERCEPEDE